MDNLPDEPTPIKGGEDYVRVLDLGSVLDRDTLARVEAAARRDGLTGHDGALVISRDRLAELLGGQP
jgi:hypothetical protein